MKKTILLIALLFAANSAHSQIDFKQGSLADIMQMAKDQNKIVMVDVMTDWCKWCIELDNKVYSKSDVGNIANANQVNYKIDAEKGEGIDFAKKYKVTGYPTILFLDAAGNEIDRIVGYVPAKDFTEMMTDYEKGVNTYSYLKASLDKDPTNIDANSRYADKLMTLGQENDAKTYLNKIIELDPENKQGKTDDAKYRLASLSDKETIIKNLETFIAENPTSDVLKDAYVSLCEAYYYSKNDVETADKWYKEALAKFPNDESVNSSYGQFLNGRAGGLAEKGTGAEDYKKGLALIDAALPYVKGSVNEASSYYLQAKLYFNLKDYAKAKESVDKALVIFNRKLYRDLKDQIEKQLSSK